MAPQAPVVTDLVLHRKSRLLEVTFADGSRYKLPFEYLRVQSPSAEVRGHGGALKLVPGKREVGIDAVEAVGRYGVLLRFDDGHDTGIYSWSVLAELGREHEIRWQTYLDDLERAGLSRDIS